MTSTQSGLPNTNHETKIFNPFDLDNSEVYPGKPSVIRDYCRKKSSDGEAVCLWMCIRRWRRDIATDIQVGQGQAVLRIDQLQKSYGWWKRYSLYSATAVRPIKASQY